MVELREAGRSEKETAHRAAGRSVGRATHRAGIVVAFALVAVTAWIESASAVSPRDEARLEATQNEAAAAQWLAETDALETYAGLPLSSLRFAGTHNSYHKRPRFLGLPFLPFAVSSKHRFAHPPLADQLEGVPGGAAPVRQLEIDVHMRRFDDELRVFHLPWIDNRSSCKTLRRCLEQVKQWSDARERDHSPILIWIEPKDDTPLDRWLTLGYYERVDAMRVEEVILEVFDRDHLIVPDDVRRGEATLPAALDAYGWPTLAESRGRVMFALLDESEHRARYVDTSPEKNLAGRLMFVRSTTPDQPFAAMFKVNDAVPTLRDMQLFGREMIADPELALLQVYPEPEKADEPPSAFSIWWKNLWESAGRTTAAGEGGEGSAGADGGADGGAAEEGGGDEAGDVAVEEAPAAAGRDASLPAANAGAKDIASEQKPRAPGVTRQVRRELEDVYAETRAEVRERHRIAVAQLEEQVRFDDAPASEELALVLENVRRSKAYREVFLEKLRHFLSENERAVILGLAREGFLVTTTADDPRKSPARNRERAVSALLSAAQFISSDSLRPQRKDGFVFDFPGDPILCNALIDAEACEHAAAGRAR